MLVGPDGLLAPALRLFGGASEVVEITRSPPLAPPEQRPRTFDGRDIFAPIAAHLALGGSLPGLGSH